MEAIQINDNLIYRKLYFLLQVTKEIEFCLISHMEKNIKINIK